MNIVHGRRNNHFYLTQSQLIIGQVQEARNVAGKYNVCMQAQFKKNSRMLRVNIDSLFQFTFIY